MLSKIAFSNTEVGDEVVAKIYVCNLFWYWKSAKWTHIKSFIKQSLYAMQIMLVSVKHQMMKQQYNP